MLKLLPCKSEVNRNKRMSFLFLIQSEHILVARRSNSNGDVVRHLGFLNRFFFYWRSIRKVYSVIDRLHVTGFIQSVCDILVRGEINTHRQCKQHVIWFNILNHRGWVYKAENFVFSPVSSLCSWHSHLFLWRLHNPVCLPGSGMHKLWPGGSQHRGLRKHWIQDRYDIELISFLGKYLNVHTHVHILP